MKRELNPQYPLQIWLTSSVLFPTLFVLCRLTEWRKEHLNVEGVFYFLLFAIIIGGILSLPSYLFSDFFYRRFHGRLFSIRSVRLLIAAGFVTAMFANLVFIDQMIYPLGKNILLIGASFTIWVVITGIAFSPLKEKKDKQSLLKTQKFSWRLLYHNRAFSG